jgi:hypothetical protein
MSTYSHYLPRSSFEYYLPIYTYRMRWAGHLALMEEGEVFTGFWLVGPKGRDHWEDLGIGGRLTLRWTFER